MRSARAASVLGGAAVVVVVGAAAVWLVAAGLSDVGAARVGGGGPGAPVRVFGRSGYGPGDFAYPRPIAIGPDESVWVVDKAGRVQRFTLDGEFVAGWRMPQSNPDAPRDYAGAPTGLTVTADKRLFLADTHYHRVAIFDYEGHELDAFGERGSGPGQFEFPTSVAIDEERFLYVAEYGGNDRISKFTPEHEYVMSFGGPDAGKASLLRPECLAFDADSMLWVADACNHRLCRFTRDGRLVGQIGRMGAAPGEFRWPYAVVITPDGNLLVSEYGNNRVQALTPDGSSLWTWGGPGRAPGELAYPWSLTLGPGGRVFVVDSGNNRVQMFRMSRM
jgi:streptogramin lyase